MVAPDLPVNRSTAIWVMPACSWSYCAEVSETLACAVRISTARSSDRCCASAHLCAVSSAFACTRRISAATCADVRSESDAAAPPTGSAHAATINASAARDTRRGAERLPANCCNLMTEAEYLLHHVVTTHPGAWWLETWQDVSNHRKFDSVVCRSHFQGCHG